MLSNRIARRTTSGRVGRRASAALLPSHQGRRGQSHGDDVSGVHVQLAHHDLLRDGGDAGHFDQQQQRDSARWSAGEAHRQQPNKHEHDGGKERRLERQARHSNGPIGLGSLVAGRGIEQGLDRGNETLRIVPLSGEVGAGTGQPRPGRVVKRKLSHRPGKATRAPHVDEPTGPVVVECPGTAPLCAPPITATPASCASAMAMPNDSSSEGWTSMSVVAKIHTIVGSGPTKVIPAARPRRVAQFSAGPSGPKPCPIMWSDA